MRHSIGLSLILTFVACVGITRAEVNSLDDLALLGIDRNTGELVRYDFATDSRHVVGTVLDAEGNPLSGIEASAYIPGFQNLFGFWSDRDSLTRLVYINVETGKATPVGADLGHSLITGAVAVENEDMNRWTVFAVRQTGGDLGAALVAEPVSIAGEININPNNSRHSEFTLVTPEGTFTRDHLHADSPSTPTASSTRAPRPWCASSPRAMAARTT